MQKERGWLLVTEKVAVDFTLVFELESFSSQEELETKMAKWLNSLGLDAQKVEAKGKIMLEIYRKSAVMEVPEIDSKLAKPKKEKPPTPAGTQLDNLFKQFKGMAKPEKKGILKVFKDL